MDLDNGFYISDWKVDPPAGLINRGETSVHLEPKVMDLLVYMSERSDQVHSREELLDNIWPGMVVSDEALTSAIIKLRKAFSDDARHPHFIETLPKRGYRLIAEVKTANTQQQTDYPHQQLNQIETELTPLKISKYRFSIIVMLAICLGIVWILSNSRGSIQNTVNPSGLALPDRPSIAVLPFVNTGNKAEHSYFSDGITNDLITDLSKLSGLFVISRNSTFQYKGQSVDIKQVAQTLGVRYILEGSVRRSADKVRVNTQLIDGTTGGQIWAERYDGDLQNVFDLQDRMTSKIISALALRLTEKDQQQLASVETNNAEAYDEFLKGTEFRWRISRESFAQAEKHFLKALELDPDYARAHAALALIYWNTWLQRWHANSGSQFAGWVRARHELDAAMIKPSPLAYSLRSTMKLHNRRYEDAIQEAKQAVALNPNSATGYLALANALGFSSQHAASIDNAKKALRRDPNFPAPYLFVEGRGLFDSHHYKEAVVILKRALKANSADYNPLIFMIASSGYLDKLEEAQSLLEQLNIQLKKDSLPEFNLGFLSNRWPYQDNTYLNHLRKGLIKASVPEW